MLSIKLRRDSFSAPLQAVSGAASRNGNLPILENVLFYRDDEAAWLTAFDMEMQIEARLSDIDCAQPFSLTVNAARFLDFMKSAPVNDVHMAFERDKLRVDAGPMRCQLNVLPADAFPRMQRDRDLRTLTLEQGQLRRMLGRVIRAVADDRLRYYLNGALFECRGERLTVVATDGVRLACHTLALPGQPCEAHAIVPRKTLRNLLALLDDSTAPVEVAIGLRSATFTFNDLRITCKVIDGEFPDYARVLPAAMAFEVDLDRQRLKEAVDRAAITANEHGGIVMEFRQDRVTLLGKTREQEEARDEIEVAAPQEGFQFAFNHRYLLDVLNALDEPRILLGFNQPDKPMRVKLPDDSDFQYIIGPMRA